MAEEDELRDVDELTEEERELLTELLAEVLGSSTLRMATLLSHSRTEEVGEGRNDLPKGDEVLTRDGVISVALAVGNVTSDTFMVLCVDDDGLPLKQANMAIEARGCAMTAEGTSEILTRTMVDFMKFMKARGAWVVWGEWLRHMDVYGETGAPKRYRMEDDGTVDAWPMVEAA